MRAPLAIDLFCGLGGWTEGLLLGRTFWPLEVAA